MPIYESQGGQPHSAHGGTGTDNKATVAKAERITPVGRNHSGNRVRLCGFLNNPCRTVF